MGIDNIKGRARISKEESLITSEYAINWTEKSPNSKLKMINSILNNQKLSKIIEVRKLKDKIVNRKFRDFQKLVWVPFNRCDWKLWAESLSYFKNFIDRITKQNRTFTQTNSYLSSLHWNIWQIENLSDTLQIQHNEAQYLASYETMSQGEYNKLFSWRDRLQQWQLWDCYLVSGINELARAQHFDTLMRTSIQRVRWKDGSGSWYQIKIPLWEPSWRKILFKDSELSVAKIRWNIWYRLLELAYAKNKLRKNDRKWNKYRPITSAELEGIRWWWTKEVLETFLWKRNISFNTFWDWDRKEPLHKMPWLIKNQITWFLKNYVPSIWNKFVSLSSIWWESDTKQYTVWWKIMYHKHAYALTWVNKDSKWNIKTITVLNPWNAKWSWKNYMSFTLDEFFKAFSYMSCWKIKTRTFLGNKAIA